MTDMPEYTAVEQAVFEAQDRSNRQRLASMAREERWERDFRIAKVAKNEFLTYCRPASADDYAGWLTGYLAKGGKIDNVYDYPLVGHGLNWWVLTSRPPSVPTLYGALSIQVIVSTGCDFQPVDVPNTFHGGAGHSTFYFMRDFSLVGFGVPLYSDVRDLLVNQGERRR